MLTLGIDTSGSVSHVALLNSDRVICVDSTQSSRVAEELVGLIDSVLKKENFTLKQLSKISVCVGPGSFTGIRTGISIASGMASALQIPLVGVSALFAAVVLDLVPGVLMASLLKASPNEYYVGLYFVEPRKNIIEVDEPVAINEQDLYKALEKYKSNYSVQKFFQESSAVKVAVASNYKLIKQWKGKNVESQFNDSNSNLVVSIKQTEAVLAPLYIKGVNAKTIIQRNEIKD